MPNDARSSDRRGFFSASGSRWRDELARPNLFDRAAKLVDRDGVVQPGVVQRVAEFLAQHADQFAAARDQRAARGAGIVRGHVEHVDRAAIRSLEDASPGLQPRNHRDRPPLNAHRLIADGDAEEVAEGQHAGALLGLHRLLEIEIGKLAAADLQHGDFESRVGAHQFRLEAAAVGQHGGDVVGVEHVAVGREDVAARAK